MDKKQRKLELLRAKKRLEEGLPHLYGFDLYPYQRDFLKQTKEWVFLCAANQIGKTTTMLLFLVDRATNQPLWAKLWKKKPQLFIYMLPNQKLHNENAKTKWKDVLPTGHYKDDPYYGWEWQKRGKDYLGIEFKNGVRISFLSYGQKTEALQNLSAHIICFDEEPNHDIVPEVQTRTAAIEPADTNYGNAFGGMKVFGFTATKSQKYFKDVFERRDEGERFPVSQGNVFKKVVSLYDCQKHVSGRPSQWTDEKINKVKAAYPTEAEINRRVYGRFQSTDGLVYQSFDSTMNCQDKRVAVPSGWMYYAGLDYGAGGTSHPSSIVIIAVSPEYNRAYVTDVWEGTGELTTADDVIDKYLAMLGDRQITQAFYDWACKDMHTFAVRRGITLNKANKSHDVGENILNSLFKNRMITIINDDAHSTTLITELMSLTKAVRKRFAEDHAVDALRYACSSVPWDFANIEGANELKEVLDTKYNGNEMIRRDGRRTYGRGKPEHDDERSREFAEWGALFE